MIRVMLVDDQDMIRAGLRAIIESDPNLAVVAEAGEGISALNLLATTAVDVVLMDIRMPGLDGVETTRRIRKAYAEAGPRILVLTTYDQDENVVNALRAGADGFLSKGASPEELIAAITDVAAGQHSLSSRAMAAVVEHIAKDRPVPGDPQAARLLSSLTPRELEIVQAIVDGLDNQQIAAQLHLSPFTVKTHANRAMMKTGARDRAQLVTIAVQAGMTPGA